jgi:hypothetical protein
MKQLLLRFAKMFFVAGNSLGHVAVITDGSLGAGGNLFHRFSQLYLNHVESAIFSA